MARLELVDFVRDFPEVYKFAMDVAKRVKENTVKGIVLDVDNMPDMPMPGHDNRTFKLPSGEVIQVPVKMGKRAVIISAPVKSGKRRIAECLTLLLDEHKHFYITSLDRKDNQCQFEELMTYNFEKGGARCVTSSKKTLESLEQLCKRITDAIEAGYRVVIHHDEADYGTGAKQCMAEIFRLYNNTNIDVERVCWLLYSATNEEAIYSAFGEHIETMLFEPSDDYCGAKRFLDEDLVTEAESFFIFTKASKKILGLSEQGKSLIEEYLAQRQRPFARLILSNYKEYNALKRYFTILERTYPSLRFVFVDGAKPFNWGFKTLDGQYGDWSKLSPEYHWLIVTNLTCTRSTEVGFHPWIYFLHDYAGKNAAYNTIAQRVLRVVYYLGDYQKQERIDKFSVRGCATIPRIKLFTSVPVIRCAAKKITIKELESVHGITISQRIGKEKLHVDERGKKIDTNGNPVSSKRLLLVPRTLWDDAIRNNRLTVQFETDLSPRTVSEWGYTDKRDILRTIYDLHWLLDDKIGIIKPINIDLHLNPEIKNQERFNADLAKLKLKRFHNCVSISSIRDLEIASGRKGFTAQDSYFREHKYPIITGTELLELAKIYCIVPVRYAACPMKTELAANANSMYSKDMLN